MSDEPISDDYDDIVEWMKAHLDIKLAPWQERLARQIFDAEDKIVWFRQHGR